MSRGACTFRKRNVTAACKAVEAAGLEIEGVEIGPDGTIRITTGKSDTTPPPNDQEPVSEWPALPGKSR